MKQSQYYLAARIDPGSFTSVSKLGPRVAFKVRKLFSTRSAAEREVSRVGQLHGNLDVLHFCYGPIQFVGDEIESDAEDSDWVHLYVAWTLNSLELGNNFDPRALISFHGAAASYATLAELFDDRDDVVIDSGKFFF